MDCKQAAIDALLAENPGATCIQGNTLCQPFYDYLNDGVPFFEQKANGDRDTWTRDTWTEDDHAYRWGWGDPMRRNKTPDFDAFISGDDAKVSPESILRYTDSPEFDGLDVHIIATPKRHELYRKVDKSKFRRRMRIVFSWGPEYKFVKCMAIKKRWPDVVVLDGVLEDKLGFGCRMDRLENAEGPIFTLFKGPPRNVVPMLRQPMRFVFVLHSKSKFRSLVESSVDAPKDEPPEPTDDDYYEHMIRERRESGWETTTSERDPYATSIPKP